MAFDVVHELTGRVSLTNLELGLEVKFKVRLTASPVYLLVVDEVMLSVIGRHCLMAAVAVCDKNPFLDDEMTRGSKDFVEVGLVMLSVKLNTEATRKGAKLMIRLVVLSITVTLTRVPFTDIWLLVNTNIPTGATMESESLAARSNWKVVKRDRVVATP